MDRIPKDVGVFMQVEGEVEDPAFSFLMKAFPTELLARAKELTEDVEIDHEAPIEGVTAL